MQYRRFGKLDWKVSALGFGGMRLPQLGRDFSSPIDEPLAIEMIRYAIDHGVNYVDTAFAYGNGASERVIGKALRDGYREKVRIATKLSPGYVDTHEGFDRYLDAQLKRLQTDKIDFYLFHRQDKILWPQYRNQKAIQWAEKKIAQGKIGYLGFSFHDDFNVFKEIIDYYDGWTFCQVQYNYLDENNQAGRKGVEYAAGKGLAVVVMEPIRGGQLARTPPPIVAKVWDSSPVKRSLAEWALQWVWNQPEISVALSGMSTMEQVVQNVTYAERSGTNILTTADMDVFKRVSKAYKSLAPIPCTGCEYCQPCPNGVAIPKIFRIYNETFITDDPRAAFEYMGPIGVRPEQRADNCKECNECLEKCPQKIEIPAMLKKAHAALTKNTGGRPPGPPPGGNVSFEE